MFDKCKFSLLVAFHIAFKIGTKKKGMSSLELSEEYELRQKTCWEFKWKIQQAMKSSGNYPLTGEVHVDEFYVGGEEDGVIGRSSDSKKKLIVVALEIVKGGVGRAYAQVIDDASATSFRPFFHKYISRDAKVVTDEWNGYKPLMNEYSIEQRKPEDGKAILMSTISGIIGATRWTQSSMCSSAEWSNINQLAYNQSYQQCALNAYTYSLFDN